jgi:ribosomal-protein-alanine N-acetyltransferase
MDRLPRTIRTPRLTLRPFELRDVEARLAYCSDAEWARYFPIAQPYTRRDAEEFVAQRQLDDWGNDPAWWAADLGGELIGHVGLWPDLVNRHAEVGYAIARPRWGQGFATEAVSAVVNAVFTTTDLERVYARADIRNVASRRVLVKVGMDQVGEVRDNRVVHGLRVDDAFYAVLKSDWTPAGDVSD